MFWLLIEDTQLVSMVPTGRSLATATDAGSCNVTGEPVALHDHAAHALAGNNDSTARQHARRRTVDENTYFNRFMTFLDTQIPYWQTPSAIEMEFGLPPFVSSGN